MLTISTQDFNRLVTFMKGSYGIDLSKKQQLIVGRLSRTIAEMGFSTFTEYVDHILNKKNPQDIEVLINKLTTNYTFFMREKTHFDFFQKTILPWLEQTKKNKVLSIWSAGCSSGEEPYTISMILKEYFGGRYGSWDTRVLATDISQRVLGTAQNAVYEEESLKDLPAGWAKKYFRKSKDTGLYTVSPDIKANVIFRTFNLMDPIQFRLKFDVIFCRNVMIYFDGPTKDALVNRFFNATVPGGYLLIGHSEGLNKANNPYDYIMPATYRKKL
ncbi:MAG: protein-glutamate O-methyltransferase CheR [Firmicutes bacterium]|nr:protein-glutamate O-methyltransferase CheR [Bacillota bacterium]